MARTWLVLIPSAVLLWASLYVAVGVVAGLGSRPGSVRLSLRHAAVYSREIAAHVAFGLLGSLAWGRPEAPRRLVAQGVTARDAPPVLLVTGLTHNRASLWMLETYLVQRGFAWVDLFERHGTVAQDAERLAERVEVLRKVSGGAQIDLVAFSTGGLVAARAAQAGSVRRLVTIGTPWRGTRVAALRCGAAGQELRYPSPLSVWPAPVEVVCIVAADDPVIAPPESGAPEGAHLVWLGDGGHVELLTSPVAFRAVLEALA